MIRRFNNRNTLIASAVAATLASALLTPSVVWAQTANATLRGKAAANATITARSVTTGATRRTTADADGDYTLVGMPPGTYTVDAGAGTETTVTLTVASTATLDLLGAAAPPPETLEEVIVTAKRPPEVKTSEVGATISQEQIQNVPQITRNFLEFADTAPGMAFSVDSSGNTALRGGAQTTSAINVFIDGVGQKSLVKEGGVSGQFFSQGNPFPQLSIGSYKVITSNYKAEFDQITSAAITAETKSGTNEFHGEVLGDYTSSNLRAETPSESAAGMKTDSNDKEYSLAFGGPIIQDKMHFFVNYEGKRYTTPVAVTPGVEIINNLDVTTLLPPNVAAQFGPASRPFTENLFFGKLDFEPTDLDRFEAGAEMRFEHQIQNVGGTTADSAGIDVKNFDKRFTARWQHSADRWFNEVIATYEDSFNNPSARSLGNGSIYTALNQNDATIVETGPAGFGAVKVSGQKGYGLQDDITLSNLNWHGDHTVKIGAKYKAVKLTDQDAGNTNPLFFYDVDATGTYANPWQAQFPKPVPGLNPVATSSNKQFGVYLQDDWATSDKLTLNLGVRWDYEETPSYLNNVTPANVVAALNGPNTNPDALPGQTYAQSLALGGININDYIGNGHNRKAPKDEIQPRLGFSYDLMGDQQHVVFGGAGRSYDRDLYDFLQVEETRQSLPQYTVRFNQPEHPCAVNPPNCVNWDPAYLQGLQNLQALESATNGGEIYLNKNELKPPHSDQFSVGIRNKVGDWNTSATVARVLSYDGFVFTLGNRYANGAFWMNGGQPWGDGVPGFGNLILGNSGIETRSTQVLLSAEKPFTEESGWGSTLAYTYTHARDNHAIDDHSAFDEATIQQYPFMASDAAPKHRLVATGTVKLPWTMILSGKLTLASPTPRDNNVCIGLTYPTGSTCQHMSSVPGNTIG